MKDYPVIRLTILFIIGIFSAKLFQISLIAAALIVILVILLLLLRRRFNHFPIYSLTISFLTGIIILSIGNLIAKENEIIINPEISRIDKVKNTIVIGKIDNIDLIRNNELLFYISADSIYSEEFFIRDDVKILCKVKIDNESLFTLYDELKPGQTVKLNGYYYKGREKRNPGEFDYDAYLKSKNILGIVLINDINSVSIINISASAFGNAIHQVRKSIDNQIKKYNSPETAALLRGLLLADRGDIKYQTKNQFINTGVVHVLSVSGLHVGYIVLIFLFLFGRMNFIVRSVLTIVGLLFYMLLTGIPPSVFRATVMSIVFILAFLSN
ncbi:MAG: ComEC/Rec2 family competence protein, partial [Ignavibacteriaceae bacterium]|nr:ComEC/Rec2 family competence protein [Ignavibacteriaceae bacterium]